MTDPAPVVPVPAIPAWLKVLAGVLTVAAAIAVAFVPPAWAPLVLTLGAVFGYLNGASFTPPAWAAGTPLLQGAAAGVSGGLGALIWENADKLPVGWPQTLAQVVGLLGFWLAGKASPQLGSTSKTETIKAAVAAGEVAAVKVTTPEQAVDALGKSP